jgi:hypothetical protein
MAEFTRSDAISVPTGHYLSISRKKSRPGTLKDKEYTYAWTAISKPPYLTALALWPKGDCWNGGGLFHSNKALALYHTPATKPHPEHKPPRWLHVTFTDRGRGEDDPISSDRLERDGWKREQEWKVENHGHPKWYHTEQPEIRQKFNRNRKTAVQLIRAINRLDYTEEFFVLTDRRTCVAPIKQARWADWDQNGRLVFCRDGRVYAASLSVAGDWKEAELANFNSSKPVPLPHPRSATIW